MFFSNEPDFWPEVLLPMPLRFALARTGEAQRCRRRVASSRAASQPERASIRVPTNTLFGNCQLSTLLSKWIDSWIDFFNNSILTILYTTIGQILSLVRRINSIWLIKITKMSILVLSQATQKRIDSPKKELTTHDSLEKRLVEWFFNSQLLNRWHSTKHWKQKSFKHKWNLPNLHDLKVNLSEILSSVPLIDSHLSLDPCMFVR